MSQLPSQNSVLISFLSQLESDPNFCPKLDGIIYNLKAKAKVGLNFIYSKYLDKCTYFEF